MRKGDVDGAVSDYNKAVELNPRSFLAFYNRAFARKQKGDLDGAIAITGDSSSCMALVTRRQKFIPWRRIADFTSHIDVESS